MLLVFEGYDGCGKNTIADALAARLNGDRMDFPNDKLATGPAIRAYLNRGWQCWRTYEGGSAVVDPLLGALAFQALQTMNRIEVLPQLLEAKGSKTKHLVLARYWQSGWVYGQLDGLEPALMTKFHAALPQPDVSFLLDAPAELCLKRRADRDGKKMPEIYEGKLEMARRICGMYRELWYTTKIPCHYMLDASQPMADIVDNALGKVNYFRDRL